MSAIDYIPRRVRPAVLLYHRVVRALAPGDPHAVSAERFEAQMRRVARGELGERSGPAASAAPRRPVVVTFDDGYLDTYDVAFPILARHGLTATVFVVSGCMGRTSDGWGPPAPARMMTWSHAEELSRHGFSIQSHTRTHPDLTRCGYAELTGELAGSRAEIEDRLGRPVDELAYPFGRFDARVVGLLEGSGYRRAWAAGLAPPGRLTLERWQITAKDTRASFALKASGWGTWLRRARNAARSRGGAWVRAAANPAGVPGVKPW